MRYNALSAGKKTPKTVPSPWDFVTLPEEDRATAIGYMHRKISKDRANGSGDIPAERQTDTRAITILRHRSCRRNKKKTGVTWQRACSAAQKTGDV